MAEAIGRKGPVVRSPCFDCQIELKSEPRIGDFSVRFNPRVDEYSFSVINVVENIRRPGNGSRDRCENRVLTKTWNTQTCLRRRQRFEAIEKDRLRTAIWDVHS